MNFWFVCLIALTGLQGEARSTERLETCYEIAVRAEAHGYDPVLLVSLAYVESRFASRAVSNVGAQGPMQVMPRYFCPNGELEGCDLVAAGMKAFGLYRRHGDPREVLCHYAAGKVCNERSRVYADRVLKKARRIRRAYARLENMLGPLDVF